MRGRETARFPHTG